MPFKISPTYFQDNPAVLPQTLFWLLLERAGGKVHASWIRDIGLFSGIVLRRGFIYFSSAGLTELDAFKRHHPGVGLTLQGATSWIAIHSDLPDIIAKYPKDNLELSEVLEKAETEASAKAFANLYIESFNPYSVITRLSGNQNLALQELLWFDFAEYAATQALRANDWIPITPEQLNYFYGLSNYFKPTVYLKNKYANIRKVRKAR